MVLQAPYYVVSSVSSNPLPIDINVYSDGGVARYVDSEVCRRNRLANCGGRCNGGQKRQCYLGGKVAVARREQVREVCSRRIVVVAVRAWEREIETSGVSSAIDEHYY